MEVAAEANPPVCRIMDFTKFKYEAQQRAKESRKKATNITVKEMKYRPKIGVGDFDTKTRKVDQFLGEGHKVKVTIMFRGREMQHPELGRRILDRVAEEVAHVGQVEAMPKQDGRNMTMVLGPDKKAQAAARQEDRVGGRGRRRRQRPPTGASVPAEPEPEAPVEEAPVRASHRSSSAAAAPEPDPADAAVADPEPVAEAAAD